MYSVGRLAILARTPGSEPVVDKRLYNVYTHVRYTLVVDRLKEKYTHTVNLANNDCGYNDNSRITTAFPCPEQSPIPL